MKADAQCPSLPIEKRASETLGDVPTLARLRKQRKGTPQLSHLSSVAFLTLSHSGFPVSGADSALREHLAGQLSWEPEE